MTKPAITLRATKGTPLTYSELDTNFTNLKDATVSLQAGTGGTTVTSDLNGTITLVAGTGITLSGDNTAKTITVTGESGVQQTYSSNVNWTTGGFKSMSSDQIQEFTVQTNSTIDLIVPSTDSASRFIPFTVIINKSGSYTSQVQYKNFNPGSVSGTLIASGESGKFVFTILATASDSIHVDRWTGPV